MIATVVAIVEILKRATISNKLRLLHWSGKGLFESDNRHDSVSRTHEDLLFSKMLSLGINDDERGKTRKRAG